MPATWTITWLPRCAFDVFLSHSGEDRASLVVPLFEALERHGIMPWVDVHHYPSGRNSHEALREGLLRCRHVVYLITESTLKQARGWVVLERAYAELLQQFLRPGDMEICHLELPLFFVEPADPRLTRSVWRSLVDRGVFCPAGENRLAWAVKRISKFLRRELEWGLEVGERIENDPQLREWTRRERHLWGRITGGDPPPIVRPA